MICIPITETSASAFLHAAQMAAEIADAIELRMDYLPDEDLQQVLDHLPGCAALWQKPLIMTFRPSEQGGMRTMNIPERLQYWQKLSAEVRNAIAFADFELDLTEALLAGKQEPPIPWEKVICSQHDFEKTPEDLLALCDRLAATPAGTVKLATKAVRIADCLKVFELIRHSPKPVIALGMGLPGLSTRILSLSQGAMLTFGALRRGAESASGQPTATELSDLYRTKQLTPESLVMGVIGNPVAHSRSPLIHNTALAASGIDGVYLPFEVDDVAGFIRDFVHPATRQASWNLRGLSVTIPHKLAIMPLLDHIDDAARAVGAVNTVVVEGNELHGYNTDVIGAIRPLLNHMSLRGRHATVLGAGGAARAIVYGLKEQGADVTICARDLPKAQTLADEFQVQAKLLEDFSGACDLVVNCTPVGMHGHDEGRSPLRANQLKDVRVVYDLIYIPRETALLQMAQEAGCQTLGGMAMLIGQAAEQFRLWTGKEAPTDLMTEALENPLK